MEVCYTYAVSLSRESGGQSVAELTETATEPRTPLNRERVLAGAVTLADSEGIESLSMRKLAHELGVEAM